MRNKKQETSYITSMHVKQIKKQSQELSSLTFTLGATAIVGFVLALGSLDLASFQFNTGTLTLAGIFLAEAVIGLLIRRKIDSDLTRTDEISRVTRCLGYLLIAMIATGNVFLCAAGLLLVKKQKTLEYTMGVYALIMQLLVIAISAVNVFKGYVMSTFFPAVGILCGISAFYLIAMLISAKHCSRNCLPKKMIPLGVLLVLSGVGGNIIAILWGVIILAKVKNKDEDISVAWIDTIKRVFRNEAACFSVMLIVFVVSLTIWANFTFDYSLAVDNNYQAILQAPSLQFPLGTDNYGRCVFTRMVFGAKVSLMVGICSICVTAFVGIVLGCIAGFYSGKIDNIIMRISDIFLAVPGLLLSIAIITSFGASVPTVILAIAADMTPRYIRTVRASVLTMRGSELVEASRACGLNDSTIMFRHILPNCMAPIIIRITGSIGWAVLQVSSLSYLGMGIDSYLPEWGNILKAGSNYLETASYLAIYPGICILLLVLSFNFLGDGIRDALDPKLK